MARVSKGLEVGFILVEIPRKPGEYDCWEARLKSEEIFSDSYKNELNIEVVWGRIAISELMN